MRFVSIFLLLAQAGHSHGAGLRAPRRALGPEDVHGRDTPQVDSGTGDIASVNDQPEEQPDDPLFPGDPGQQEEQPDDPFLLEEQPEEQPDDPAILEVADQIRGNPSPIGLNFVTTTDVVSVTPLALMAERCDTFRQPTPATALQSEDAALSANVMHSGISRVGMPSTVVSRVGMPSTVGFSTVGTLSTVGIPNTVLSADVMPPTIPATITLADGTTVQREVIAIFPTPVTMPDGNLGTINLADGTVVLIGIISFGDGTIARREVFRTDVSISPQEEMPSDIDMFGIASTTGVFCVEPCADLLPGEEPLFPEEQPDEPFPGDPGQPEEQPDDPVQPTLLEEMLEAPQAPFVPPPGSDSQVQIPFINFVFEIPSIPIAGPPVPAGETVGGDGAEVGGGAEELGTLSPIEVEANDGVGSRITNFFSGIGSGIQLRNGEGRFGAVLDGILP